MKRGDVVVVALQGDLGKPRPAVILQSDHFEATLGVTLVPVTSEIVDSNLLRISIMPNAANGLREPSQIMIDKITTAPRQKVGQVIGELDHATLLALNAQLAFFLDLN